MFQKLLTLLAILAVSAAFAGTVPAPGGATYKVTFTQPSVVSGTHLEAGDYRIQITPDKVTIGSGKNAFDVKAKVEMAEQKFDATAIRYDETASGRVVSEIRIGGTKTRLVLE